MGREYKPSTCRSCGASIMWVKTRKGKNMPIDHDPELEHRFVDVQKGSAPEYDPDCMTSHFDTCPNAADHRRE